MRKPTQLALRIGPSEKFQKHRKEAETNGCVVCGKTALYMKNGKGFCRDHKEEAKKLRG